MTSIRGTHRTFVDNYNDFEKEEPDIVWRAEACYDEECGFSEERTETDLIGIYSTRELANEGVDRWIKGMEQEDPEFDLETNDYYFIIRATKIDEDLIFPTLPQVRISDVKD